MGGSGRCVTSTNVALPKYEYPVPVVIRNTFIDAQVPRPLSLDDFFEERRIHSCPVEVHDNAYDDEQDEDEPPPAPQPLRCAVTASIATGAQAFMTTVAAATGFWIAPQSMAFEVPSESVNAMQPRPHVLMLSEALPEPVLGSSEM